MKNFRERIEYVKNGRQCGYTSVDIPEEFIRAICSTERPVKVKVSCDGNTITIKYYDEIAEKRKVWVREQLSRMKLWETTHTRHKNTIFVAVKAGGCMRCGVASPTHNDKFDENIGIAVAFTKALGEKVPNYI